MNGPSYPDPKKTADAQLKLNIGSAQAQQELNQVNQVTPTGSLTYKVVGKNKDGTPRYQATTTLAPGQQQIFDTGQATQQNLSGTAKTLSAGLPGKLNGLAAPTYDQFTGAGAGIQRDLGPSDFSSDRNAVEQSLFDRLNPQLDKQDVSLRTRLAGQGIKEGSEAWNNAIDAEKRQRNDLGLAITAQGLAEQQGQQGLALNKGNFVNSAQNQNFTQQTGQTTGNNLLKQQGFQDKITGNNQNINQIAALLSGSPVASPNFQNTPTAGVQSPDYTGQVQGQFNSQQTNYNNQMGALGSAAATVGGWLFSDETLKEDIHSTGAKTADGIPLKTFRYKGSPMLEMGVMAQDAEKKRPDAVRTMGGKKMVNYDKIGSPMLRLGKAA